MQGDDISAKMPTPMIGYDSQRRIMIAMPMLIEYAASFSFFECFMTLKFNEGMPCSSRIDIPE